jgi:hypothetical protein
MIVPMVNDPKAAPDTAVANEVPKGMAAKAGAALKAGIPRAAVAASMEAAAARVTGEVAGKTSMTNAVDTAIQ